MVCFVRAWPRIAFRYASLAAKLERRCNMLRWTTTTDLLARGCGIRLGVCARPANDRVAAALRPATNRFA